MARYSRCAVLLCVVLALGPKPSSANTSRPLTPDERPQLLRSPVSARGGNATTAVSTPERSGPCRCVGGECGCCTGPILAAVGQRACLNITYEPDDFAFTAKMSVNERVLYRNRLSGKNPPPACVRLPRFREVRLCAKISNVYFSGPNVHACLGLKADYGGLSLVDTSFDCVRLGAAGFAVLGPEEGGGANGVDEEDVDSEEDYDDSA